MASICAFLHHLAAFALVAGLAVELVLIRGELGVAAARTLRRVDLAVGIAAGLIVVVGLLRVFNFEKGSYYYSHSVPFYAKMSLFVLIALLSIYPTVEFLSWRDALKQGRAPVVSERKLRRIRSLIHWELAAVVFLIAAAALMARGVGYIGA